MGPSTQTFVVDLFSRRNDWHEAETSGGCVDAWAFLVGKSGYGLGAPTARQKSPQQLANLVQRENGEFVPTAEPTARRMRKEAGY
jgi:hypothetical protein